MGFLDRFTTTSRAGAEVDDRLPPDAAARLARLGRRLVEEGGGLDRRSEIDPFRAGLAADPGGVVDAVVRLGTARGGWTAFGAQRWLRSVAPSALSSARAQDMAAAGIEWAVAQGYAHDLDGWERQLAPGDTVF